MVTAGSTTSGARATRSFDTASVAPGGQVEVTIAATAYGGFGAVTETLPAGFSYVSANNIDADQVTEEGQNVTFIFQEANKSFTYTVTASGAAGTYDFSGQLRDSDRVDRNVGGAASVMVTAGSTTSGARATRSFDTASVAPGGQVEVTIAATAYGGFGAVTETLPAGFSYVSANNIDADQVTEEEQNVTFIFQEANKSFTYTVTASGAAGTYDFSGQLRDSDRVDRNVGGAASVMVTGPRATRSFSPSSVRPSGRVTVTIAATSYGGFGAVTETLPAGFSYVSANNIDADQVTEEEQTVTFILREANKSFTYTVTASARTGTYSFSGQLRDSDRGDHNVGGKFQRKRQKGIHWRRRRQVAEAAVAAETPVVAVLPRLPPQPALPQ